ncbi:hypothetical protein HK096_005985 [Nowakowskiella sp. JEL0078]|nr:hypothetical protein HK096_005985 [Nowakowskiella sp. JEL0078]
MFAPQFPNVKWILPHAPERKITLNGGMQMPGWYDIFSLTDRNSKLDEKGILQSVDEIKKLVKGELELGISENRIVVGGFSQGGALTLTSAIMFDTKLGGFFSLSGYLPLIKSLEQISKRVNIETPIFMSHGENDMVVQLKWSQLSYTALTSEYVSPYFLQRMGHDANQETLTNLMTFLKDILG